MCRNLMPIAYIHAGIRCPVLYVYCLTSYLELLNLFMILLEQNKQDNQPRTEYLKFFKFYYDKLSVEHRRWSASQISTIIKLLWKKKLATDKAAVKASLRAPISRKKKSGRMTFRKNYGYSGIEALERWKQLPTETRRYWTGKGEGLRSGERRRIPASINSLHFRRLQRKSSADSAIQLGFLKRPISA